VRMALRMAEVSLDDSQGSHRSQEDFTSTAQPKNCCVVARRSKLVRPTSSGEANLVGH
jgi:hypothetical protein